MIPNLKIKVISNDECFYNDEYFYRTVLEIDGCLCLSALTNNQRRDLSKLVFSAKENKEENKTILELAYSKYDAYNYYHNNLKDASRAFAERLCKFVDKDVEVSNKKDEGFPWGLETIKYDGIFLRSDGNYDVHIGNIWGVLNKDGEKITEIEYKNRLMFVKPDETAYRRFGKYSEKELDFIVVEDVEGLKGVMDKQFSFILPLEYDEIYIHGEYFLASKSQELDTESEDKYDEEYGLYDEEVYFALFSKAGKQLTRFIYSENDCRFSPKEIELCRYDGSGDFVDDNGYAEHYKVFDLYDGKGVFITGGYTKRLAENNLYIFIFGGYYEEHVFDEDEYGQIWNVVGHPMSFVNKDTGTIITDENYTVMPFSNAGRKISMLHKKWHYDEQKDIIVNDEDSNENILVVYIEHKKAYSLTDGHFLKVVYKERQPLFLNGKFKISQIKKDSLGLYILQSKTISIETAEICNAYDAIGLIGYYFYIVRKDDKIGIADEKGLILPCKYEAISMRIGKYIFLMEQTLTKKYNIYIADIYDIKNKLNVCQNVSLNFCKRFFNELIATILYSSEEWEKEEAIESYNSKVEFELRRLLTENNYGSGDFESEHCVKGWMSVVNLNLSSEDEYFEEAADDIYEEGADD